MDGIARQEGPAAALGLFFGLFPFSLCGKIQYDSQTAAPCGFCTSHLCCRVTIAGMCDKNKPDTPDRDNATGLVVETKPKTKKPSMYKVLMLNDDYTPMEFVVHVLEQFFGKNREEATRIMLHVHRRGVGICGVFTYEVAETKVTQVVDYARRHQHPLQCTLEKE